MAGVELDVAAAVDVEIGEDAGARRAPAPMTPPLYSTRARGSALLNGSNVVVDVIEVSGPVEGRMWDVRKIAVTMDDPTGAARLKPLAVYVCADNPVTFDGTTSYSIDNPSAADDFASSYPCTLEYGKGQMLVQPGENVYIVIAPSTNNDAVRAIVRAIDFPVGDVADYMS